MTEPKDQLEHAHARIDGDGDTSDNARRAVSAGELPLEMLIAEIGRYVAVVEVFRSEGCEPRWA